MTTLPGALPVRPGRARAWLLASRPPTLTAAVAPVIVGTAVALRADAFAAGPALAALFGAIALQVGANFANDVSDFRRGADHAGRLGPPRAAAMGMLSERAIVRGMLVAFAIAALLGLYLATVVGWPIIVVGLASIAAAVTYTGGPWPYGYRALGEIFVFIFFGVVAVAGTYYAQAGELSRAALAASVPVGLTGTAILVVNNVRDIESDRVAHKYTLAVYLGRRLARGQYLLTVAGAYVAVAALWLAGDFSPAVMLAWLSLPATIAPARAVLTQTAGPPLNAALRATARLHFVFAVLLALGVLW